jgi:hypothetical protein
MTDNSSSVISVTSDSQDDSGPLSQLTEDSVESLPQQIKLEQPPKI